MWFAAETVVTFAASLYGSIIEINGVVYTSTDVDSCSSRQLRTATITFNHLLKSFSSVIRSLTSWAMQFSFSDKNFSF